MEIKGVGPWPSAEGPSEWFTGTVRIGPLFEAPAPARARRQCHVRARRPHGLAHPPLGQTLIVAAGCGRAQRWGGPVEEMRPGDMIWFEPGEKHWHGATATTAMTHIAIQEELDGKTVDWMEQVSDDQHRE